MPDAERLTLANGVQLIVCHAPWLKRCAASLRVAAGSHDAPPAWPGLAHFLEHLFFLGTARFDGDQNLMSFVQRHGGQINASTRERTTDYFFELPPPVLNDGLERLCQMLTSPRLAVQPQLREREVLHAEFIAWTRDAQSRYQRRLLNVIEPQHPLRAFHAGNRYSLPVHNPAFQQALTDYHARFYRGAHITLCLTGPQPTEELRALGCQWGALFAGGRPAARPLPPALRGGTRPSSDQPDPSRQHWLFAFEDLPAGSDQAMAFVCQALQSPHPGGLLDALQARSLASELKAQPLYQHAGQWLLDIECRLQANASHAATGALLFQWLRFFDVHWPAQVDEYQRLCKRRLETSEALGLARHFAHALPDRLDRQGAAALQEVLHRMQPQALLYSLPVHDTPLPRVDWQLPTPNRFLHGRSVHNPDHETDNAAAVFIQWLVSDAQAALGYQVGKQLAALCQQAEQAGVNLTFTPQANLWQFRLTGFRLPLLDILEQALQVLEAGQQPADLQQPPAEPPLMPIRQLLKRLPQIHAQHAPDATSSDPRPRCNPRSRIHLGVGLDQAQTQRLDSLLAERPAACGPSGSARPQRTHGKHWFSEPGSGSEQALLLFCAMPGFDPVNEAAWRLLAHILQAPFYQRLRVEQQLGYAVFSRLHQLDGQTGILFGVQSPDTPVARLLEHIEHFIERLPELIETTDLADRRQTLATQLDQSLMPFNQLAELQWQAHLAGHNAGHLARLQTALNSTQSASLLTAAQQMRTAAGGWWLLANHPW